MTESKGDDQHQNVKTKVFTPKEMLHLAKSVTTSGGLGLTKSDFAGDTAESLTRQIVLASLINDDEDNRVKGGQVHAVCEWRFPDEIDRKTCHARKSHLIAKWKTHEDELRRIWEDISQDTGNDES